MIQNRIQSDLDLAQDCCGDSIGGCVVRWVVLVGEFSELYLKISFFFLGCASESAAIPIKRFPEHDQILA